MTIRVAFVMPGVGIVERGAEAFITDLGQALHRDHAVDVTLFSRGPSQLPHQRVRAIARDGALNRLLARAPRLVRKALATAFLDPLNIELYSAAISAYRRLDRGRYDVVVMEGGLVGAWLCRWLRWRRGTRFVDIAHGNQPKWEVAFARQRPDRVVTFTHAAAAMIQRGAPGARIEVIPHGVDLARFHPSVAPEPLALPRPVVLTAGAIEPVKRMPTTVEAVARLGRGSLVVLGDGPDAERLDQLAIDRLGTDRYLRRRVSRDEMPRWHRAADVFTLASANEAFGLVYLEAIACGVPCVAPDDPVRREVLADAAILCDVDDADAYARALDAALGRNWHGRPRHRASELSFADTVRAYARLLEELAA